MRMWLVNPKMMCRKHLLGEHVELHMFVGTINKNKNLNGYIKNNLLEYSNIYQRHNKLVAEMKNRQYNHKSELPEIIGNVDEYVKNYKINKEQSLNDLLSRCEICKKLFNEL